MKIETKNLLLGVAIGAVATHILYRHWPIWCAKPPLVAWPNDPETTYLIPVPPRAGA